MAGHVIEVQSFYERVHDYCREYAADEAPEITVVSTQADIAHEYALEVKCAAAEGREVRERSEPFCESFAIYRRIAEEMTAFDTVLFHSSVVSVDGAAYLFTAKSGTGKSTHTRLWRELLGARAVMVNDDMPLVQITRNGVIVHGTPYTGKHHIGNKIAVPLKAVCILEHAPENHIERIARADAYPMLVQQILRPRDPLQMVKTMQLIDILADSVELYRLGCNMDISAAQLAYHTMKG